MVSRDYLRLDAGQLSAAMTSSDPMPPAPRPIVTTAINRPAALDAEVPAVQPGIVLAGRVGSDTATAGGAQVTVGSPAQGASPPGRHRRGDIAAIDARRSVTWIGITHNARPYYGYPCRKNNCSNQL
jgi:hypothetical protein